MAKMGAKDDRAKRRKFTDEFNAGAVRLVLDSAPSLELPFDDDRGPVADHDAAVW
jgi:hypothetical protein